jgi:hypothetical protein
MHLLRRVALLSADSAHFLKYVHREMAQAMLLAGEATYESERIIRLTNAERRTPAEQYTPHGCGARRPHSHHGDSGRAAAPLSAYRLHFVVARSNAQ